jgi:xylan 1,4-beta-xylosidase
LGWQGGNVVESVVLAEDNTDVAGDVILNVNFEKEEGNLSRIFTPSMFVTYSKANAKKIIKKEIDHLGLLRITVENALYYSKNFSDYKKRLSSHDKEVLSIVNGKAGEVMLIMGKLPPWLSSNPSQKITGEGWTVCAASPPKNYSQWAEVVCHTVDHFNNELGLELFYEIWAEPDSGPKHFWLGTQEEFLKLYKYTVLGAKQADPEAKVVAPSAFRWNGAIEDPIAGEDAEAPLIYDLIRFSAETPLPRLNLKRIPLEFISFHMFDYEPFHIEEAVNQINGWSEKFEYQNARLIISEGNCAMHDRDSLKQAAYYLAMLKNMDENGIYRHCFLGLQDVHSAQKLKSRREFHQEFGMITRDFAIKKPVYNAVYMLNMLGKTRIKTSIANSQTIDAIATKDTDKMAILVWNYIPPPMKVASHHLRSLGYSKDSFKKFNISKRDIKKLIKEKTFPKYLSLPKDVKKDLNEARRLFLEQNKLIESSLVVRLAIDNLPYDSFKYERYLIDKTHSNFRYYYEKAKAEGKSEERAVKDAMAHQYLEKVEQKTLGKNDNLPSISFKPYSINLIILKRLYPNFPNELSTRND